MSGQPQKKALGYNHVSNLIGKMDVTVSTTTASASTTAAAVSSGSTHPLLSLFAAAFWVIRKQIYFE